MKMTKLKHPNSEIDFDPTPGYLVGGFGIYDREESLGEELSKFDPNKLEDLKELMDKYFFSGYSLKQWSVQHKARFIEVLESALQDADYDLVKIISDDHDECFYLPWNWVIRDVRLMFLRMYGIVAERWRSELEENGYVVHSVESLVKNPNSPKP